MPTTRSQAQRSQQIRGRRGSRSRSYRTGLAPAMAQSVADVGRNELCYTLMRFNDPDIRANPVDRIRSELTQAALRLLPEPRANDQSIQDAVTTLNGPIHAIDNHRRKILYALHSVKAREVEIQERRTDLNDAIERICEYIQLSQRWEAVRTAQFAAGVVVTSLEHVLLQVFEADDFRDEFINNLIINTQTGQPQPFLRWAMEVTECDGQVLRPFANELEYIANGLAAIDHSRLHEYIEPLRQARITALEADVRE